MISLGKMSNKESQLENEKTTAVIQNSTKIIDVIDNSIYFYSTIDAESILRLNREIRNLNNTLLHQSIIQKSVPSEIWLYINSFGGNITDGLSGMDTITNSTIKINTVIEGTAASAATFLSVVGHKRYIKKHSYILIHQIHHEIWSGNYENLKDIMINNDKFMSAIKNIYKQYTKIPMKDLNEILKHDIWFDAEEALKYSLVDEII